MDISEHVSSESNNVYSLDSRNFSISKKLNPSALNFDIVKKFERKMDKSIIRSSQGTDTATKRTKIQLNTDPIPSYLVSNAHSAVTFTESGTIPRIETTDNSM